MLNNNDLDQILIEELEKADILTLNLMPISSHVEIRGYKRFYGKFTRSNGVGQISISKYFLGAPKDEIRAVIMHEILHGIKGSSGHDLLWQVGVMLVVEKYGNAYENRQYHLDGFLDRKRNRMNHTNIDCIYEKNKYACQCKVCGEIIYRKRLTKFVKQPQRFLHVNCGGNFERIA